MADKKIRLHPFVDGEQDKSTNLYPETTIDAVQGLQDALDSKQGELTPAEKAAADSGITSEKVAQYDGYETGKQDTIDEQHKLDASLVDGLEEQLVDFVKKETKIGDVEIGEGIDKIEDLKYEEIEKEVVIPNYAIDGNEYTLPSTYDFNKLTILDDENTIYEDEENHIVIGTFSEDDFKVIWVNLEETSPFYSNQTNEWVIQESQGARPVPYTEPITFTYNESCLQNEEYKEILSQILGLEPTIEHITIDRTLKQKNEDIKNWPYNRIEHKEKVYGLKDETQYKLNFNVGNVYEEFDFDSVSLYGCSKDYLSLIDVNSDKTIRIDYSGNTYFYRQSDLQWVDNVLDPSEAHIYTPEELENLTFTFYRESLNHDHPDISDEQIETLFRKFVVNVDGTPVPEDHEEVIIEIKTLDDEISEPLKNKLYQVIEEEVEVPNNIIDGNEYYFKENMEINLQTMQEYFKGLKSEDFIYNNEETGECIQFIVDTPSRVDYAYARLRYINSSSNSYDYLIANIMSLTPTFINEWDDGALDFPITIYTEYIMDEDILKLMLNVGTHKEIIYKNQTLEEKNADLPNWLYEYKLGFFDVPKWDKFEDFEIDYATIYENIPHLVIQCDYYNDVYSVMIRDIDNDKGYNIADKEQSYSGITFKANTWYEQNLRDHESLPVECETPQIVLDKQYIIPEYEELFNSIYGNVKKTLKQKIDEIEEKINNVEPLKDKIYSNSGDLVDGEEYKLKEDYTEFFDKYAHGQSTLIYGESSPTPILADAVSTKGGEAILDPGIDIPTTPTTNNPTILEIYLYTDSTPTPIKDGLTRDGAIQYDGGAIPAPDYPVLGGASIDVYTDRGTIMFNQGGDGWYYNGNKIPTEELPTLILDSSLIQNEEMLKDFIGGSPITLEQKFDEVENAELQNKIYEKREVLDVMSPKYLLKNVASQIYSILNYDLYASQNVEKTIYADYTNEISVSAKYTFSGDNNVWVYLYVKELKYTCSMRYNTSYGYSYQDWSLYNQDTEKTQEDLSEEDLPTNLLYDENCITSFPSYQKEYFKTLFNLICNIGKLDTSIKLKDKFNEVENKINTPLKDKTYEIIEKEVPIEELEEKEYVIRMKDIHVDVTGRVSGEVIADSTNPDIMLQFENNSNNVLCVQYYNEVDDIYLFFNEEANEWQNYYGLTYDGEQLKFTPDLSGYYQSDILYELLRDVETSPITLEEKNNDFSNWPYKVIPSTYRLKTPDWENISVSNISYNLYQAGSYPNYNYEENYCYLANVNYAYEIETYETDEVYKIEFQKVIGFDNDNEPIFETYCNFSKDCVVGFGSTQEITKGVWYKYGYDDVYEYPVFEEIENANMLFHEYYMNYDYGDTFVSLLEFVPEQITTLEERIEKPLKDCVYETHTIEEDIPYGYRPKYEMELTKILSGQTSESVTIYEDEDKGINFACTVYKSGSTENHDIRYHIHNNTYYFDIYRSNSGGYVNEWEVITSQDDLPPFDYDPAKVNPTYQTLFESIIIQNFIHKETEVKTTLDEKLNEIETLAITSEIDVNDWEQTVNPIIASTYPYQATIQNNNLIKSIKCEVEFGLNEMLSENYAPYYECDNETGELIIFAKQIPQSNINIKIIRWLGKTIINS